MKRLFSFIVLALVQTLVQATASAEVVVSEAYIRLGPPGAPAAAYFQLHNTGKAAQTLIAVDAPWAGMTMLHESREQDGQSRMRHVEQVAIPSNGHSAFTPGGLHVMIMQPGQLKVGEQRELVLRWADGKRQALQVPVRNF